MKIIHVVLGKANPERMNGVNKVVNELATQQSAAGLSVSVWGIAANEVHDYPYRNYETLLFRKSRFPFTIPDPMKEAVLASTHGTVFHLHGGFIPQMYALGKFLYENCIPFVFTPHGAYNAIATNKNKFVKAFYMLLFESKMLGRADEIHVLGESEVQGLKRWRIKKAAKVIPYGMNVSPVIEKVQIATSPFIVGYCGRIDIKTKGLDALLGGFKHFNQQIPDSELWIVGDGGEMQDLKDSVRKAGIAGKIVFHGAKYGLDKELILKHCNIFAHPSRNEGLPASILEAASLGIPCLVTRATNVGTQIESFRAGVVIENTDASEVADGLKKMYDNLTTNNKSVTMSTNARKMISEAYNWKKLLDLYRALYAGTLV